MELKSLRELYTTSPEARSVVDSSPCALDRLLPRSWDGSHQGGLSSSHQGQAWRSPVTEQRGKRCHGAQLVSLQKRGGIFHIILFSFTHIPRKYNQALLGFEIQAGKKPQMWNLTEWKLCKDFRFQTCMWDWEYQKNKCLCSFVGSLETVYPFWNSDYKRTL